MTHTVKLLLTVVMATLLVAPLAFADDEGDDGTDNPKGELANNEIQDSDSAESSSYHQILVGHNSRYTAAPSFQREVLMRQVQSGVGIPAQPIQINTFHDLLWGPRQLVGPPRLGIPLRR
jgi:hypothetical protein